MDTSLAGGLRQSVAGEDAVDLRPTVARVDLAALKHNLGVVAARAPAARVLAVVKANAYGHGAVQVGRALVDAGAWGLSVSLVEEGVELRAAGVTGPVIVLGGLPSAAADVLLHHALTPVVWTVGQLDRIRAAVRRRGGEPARVHLKIDTGMTRLGVLPQDLSAIVDWLCGDAGESVVLEGVMTHFACADDIEDTQTSARQLQVFEDCWATLASRGLSPQLRHACNSAALARFDAAHFDLVRPGIALYGSAAAQDVQLAGLKPTLSWGSRILALREVPAGVRVSYGGRDQLHRPSTLAVVPVGYGDGYARNMSGQAHMLVRGQRARVVGTITMDTTMVDVTDLEGVQQGEEVTLLGPQGAGHIDVHEMARWAGVVSYEVLCGVSERVPRRYT